MITASMLYSLVECPHRPTLDLFGDPAKKDAENPFVMLLWERGTKYEELIVSGLKTEFANLKTVPLGDRLTQTTEAMAARVTLIYGGRIQSADLLGEPDLLRLEGNGYVAIDIKSGRGEEDGESGDGRPKEHYAVQLGLYQDILERLGLASGRHGYILDIHGREVRYDFDQLFGVKNPRSIWADYLDTLALARRIAAKEQATRPAYAASCKLCHWYSHCLGELKGINDLTLIPELGRSKREALGAQFPTIDVLAESNPNDFIKGKKTDFPGIGPDSLHKFHRRAALRTTGGAPYLRRAFTFPTSEIEIYFDIEVDPLREFCYLHGFVERNLKAGTWDYKPFFAERHDQQLEQDAFAASWAYVSKRGDAPIYYYSKYERTWWRNLANKWPKVCNVEDVNALFNAHGVIDLYYDVVQPISEWPTIDYSIKTLAQHLGFKWRDNHPSGAASVEWFDRWITEGDPAVRDRILQYNEDDCRATGILLDGLRAMPVA